ncbi:hypothetical protein VPH35_124668 [Triticum aestivum]
MATETEPAAPPRSLLGPPIIRGARPSPGPAMPHSHPSVGVLDAAADAPSAAEIKAELEPRRALTENGSASYLACNLRGVRGTGKSDKEGFYAAALWLHQNHPRTLACNVAALAEFGYLKDLPELLFRLIHGPDVRRLARESAAAEKADGKEKDYGKPRLADRKQARVLAPVPPKPMSGAYHSAALAGSGKGKPMEVEAAPVPVQEPAEQKPKRRPSKKVRKVAKLAVKSLETYYGDRAHRFLFDAVADFFAALLATDLEQLALDGKKRKIGLAAKWCPTPGSSFDRTTLFCEAIARRLFPRDSDPEYAELSDEHYTYQTLHRLRREVLVPLRKVLELPEVYMSAQRWSELPYTRVASVAMRRYKVLFKKHDGERFDKYLEDVEAGKAKISAGALLPHEIAAAAYRGEDDDVSELQWRRMVDDLRSKGSSCNCISVCDVSGSMTGTPMEVCIALGVLTSELSEEPWAGKVITFSERPELQLINGKTLREKMRFVQRMEWDMNTNFQAVFDQILRTAVEARLAPEKMIRTVFVYSDMEFDEASGHEDDDDDDYSEDDDEEDEEEERQRSWNTDYKVICQKFRDAGYGDVVPQIIFWNLRDSKSMPVTSTQPGVAMVSGFSKNFLKIFLKRDGVVNPEAIMMEAIAGDEYQKLAVFD